MNDQNNISDSSSGETSPETRRLNAPEAAYVDEMLSQGYKPGEGMPPTPIGPEKESFARIHQVFKALSKLPEEPAPQDLASRTLMAIRKNRIGPYGSDDAALMPATGSLVLRRSKMIWNQRATDFAVMLAAASLLVVITLFGLGRARENAARYACEDNLQHIGSALGQYAVVYAGMLPQVAAPHDGNWLPPALTPDIKRSSDAHSNLANLAPLVNG